MTGVAKKTVMRLLAEVGWFVFEADVRPISVVLVELESCVGSGKSATRKVSRNLDMGIAAPRHCIRFAFCSPP